MGSRAASFCLLCALAGPPAAFAADASTGGAVAPGQPVQLRQVAPVPTVPAPAPVPAAPAPAPHPEAVPVAADPAPLAATPEAAVRDATVVSSVPVAAPQPARAPAPVAAPIELAAVVRDSPPLRAPSAMAAQGGDAGDPDVVEIPVPRPAAPVAAPTVALQLPRTGFDIGLMVAAGLAMIAVGLMITATIVPPEPAGRGRPSF